MTMEKYVADAVKLRKKLHKVPEASMKELKTKALLAEYTEKNTDLEIHDCGQWFYAVWNGSGEPIAFRADFDAVTGEDGVCRHICGHDGHSAVLAVFGKLISDIKPNRKIYLIFQPGEESGEGGKLCSSLVKQENIKEIYGFHNIPGYPCGQILLKKGTFACASEGVEIKLTGSPAHAAYPENGKNPAAAIAEIITAVNSYVNLGHRGMLLATVIGMECGSSSYGVSASEGTLRFTLRAEYSDEFEALSAYAGKCVSEISSKYELGHSVTEHDVFPATENHDKCVRILEFVSEKSGMEFDALSEPFRWSEDFGWYLSETEGAYFGVGAGENTAPLHSEDYEFPDSCMSYILKFLAGIAALKGKA